MENCVQNRVSSFFFSYFGFVFILIFVYQSRQIKSIGDDIIIYHHAPCTVTHMNIIRFRINMRFGCTLAKQRHNFKGKKRYAKKSIGKILHIYFCMRTIQDMICCMYETTKKGIPVDTILGKHLLSIIKTTCFLAKIMCFFFLYQDVF